MPSASSKSLLVVVLIACALPTLCMWLGFDLGMRRDGATAINQQILHSLLEWSGFAAALAAVALCLLHHRSKREPIVLILAAAVLCAGAIDATHTLTSIGLISTGTADHLLYPITWTIGRTLFILIILAGTFLVMRAPAASSTSNPHRMLVPLAALAALACIVTTIWLGTLANLPATVFPERILKHPFDLLPLALFVYAGLWILPKLRRNHDGPFVRALQISMLPSAVAQLHLIFGSQQPCDHHLVAAQILKAVAYLVPVAALAYDYHVARKDAVAGEQLFQSIFKSSPDAMFVINPQTDSIVDANERAAELLGYSREELRSMTISDIHPDEMAKVKAFAEAAMAQGSATTDSLTCLSKDGRKIPAEISGAFFMNDRGDQLMIAQVRDITPRLAEEARRRKLEGQLVQAQKMEAIGRLAGGIAHDFNNMLTVINGYAEIALAAATQPKLRDCARAVLDAGNRAANLTSGLLAFSRSQIQQPETLDLNQVVKSLRVLLQRIISENIELICTLSEDSPQVLMDRGQLDQVIMNLMLNARDAMPDGGQLTIATAIARPGESDKHLLNPGQYVIVSVTDTGTGIEPAIREHIFDPFFTTKEIGKGTGLGLSTVYGIVSQNGGAIEMQSAAGLGTTFTILLPLSDLAADQNSAAKGCEQPSVSARVLVVEDDDMVRNLVCQTLRGKGCEVTSASDGAAGLEHFTKHSGDIDLLVTDIVMPKMSGIDLAEHARRSAPDLPVLFISGHANHGDLGGTPLPGMLLRKPFSLSDLLRAVAKALASRQPSV